MKQAFIDMIYFFSCGSLDIKPTIDHEVDITEIHKQAVSQGVWPIVFFAVKSLYDDGKLNIDNEIFNNLKYQTIATIATNTSRIHMVHTLLQKFENDKVKYCVLKGETLSHLYANADCRISNDTDILIDNKNIDRGIKILKELDFEVTPHYATSHHIVANHPIAGCVELHLQLYDELCEDVWFDNKILDKEEYRVINADDGSKIPTLGITDGLIFVTLHYIKHFLSRGVGIRQLMDVLLYMKRYNKKIDWKRFDYLMKYLKYQNFIYNSIGIGVKYLNINKEDMPKYNCDENIMDKILHDIEDGGVFGKNEDERSGFYKEYTKARFNRFKQGNYESYMKKWWRPNLISIIFPHYKNLILKFPYIQKAPLLYPFAWLHRMIIILIKVVRKEKFIGSTINPVRGLISNDIVKKRMDLIRELDMI